MENKITHGQFYTKGNPFTNKVFKKWFNSIPDVSNKTFVEPYAGANNIIKLLKEAKCNIIDTQWSAYDIDPEAIQHNTVPKIKVVKQDTIKHYPKAEVCITNPPYLAKNSATRKNFNIDFGTHSDLYEICLEQMLKGSKWVAAIIPESFISRGIFTERLYAVISLNWNMFDDTEFPVCLALFTPTENTGYTVYVGETFIGKMGNIINEEKKLLTTNVDNNIKFNIPDGKIGLKAVDNTVGESIGFVRGETILSSKVKHTSRAITRIQLEKTYTDTQYDNIISEANNILKTYRETTGDVLLTSFKGLRKDNKYRRRLDFNTANKILCQAVKNLNY
jgi:hypothetical protein